MSEKQLKISDLVPDDKNYNKGNEFGNSLIEKSLRKNGAGRSILLDKNNRIIAGNKTIENAGSIGMEDIIVVETTGNQIVAVKRTDIDLDSKKGREMALADNATAKANIEWDFDALDTDWTVDEQKDWGIVNDWVEEPEAEEDDYEIPDEIETDIVLGDLFEIGQHRLLCGDSTDSDAVAKLMNGQKADMVFTDPPYGVDYKGINNDDRAGLKELLHGAFSNYVINSKSGGSVYCCHSDKCSDIFNEVFRKYCHFSCQIIWVKDSLVMSRGDYHSKHEPIFYGWFLNGSHKFEGDRKQTTVWEFARPKKSEGHSTMKPVGLVAKGIENSSKSEDLIMDLFLGSGTTMVASHQLNRKCYGMELDPKYCEVIVQRMLKLDPSIEIKRNGVKYEKTVENQLVDA